MSPYSYEFAFAGSRSLRKQADTSSNSHLLIERDCASGAEGNSDAKNCASHAIRLGRIVAPNFRCCASSIVTVLVRNHHRNSVAIRARTGLRSGQGLWVLGPLLGAARMLVSARHGGRRRHHEQRRRKPNLRVWAAGMVMHSGRGLIGRFSSRRYAGPHRRGDYHSHALPRKQSHHNCGDESVLHSQPDSA